MKDLPDKTIEKIGLEKVRCYDVTDKDIKRFAQAINDSNPKFRDTNSDKATFDHSIVAPPLFCQAFAFEDVELEELPPDGSPVEINIPLPVKKTVGGSSIFEIYEEVKAGDRITVKSKISDIFKKQGKTGLLYFISVETCFFNQHDKMVSKEIATFIKR